MLKNGDREELALPTIYSAYRPVEEYLDRLEEASIAVPEPRLLAPIDALLLRLLLRLSPTGTGVLDFACDATQGISTLIARSEIRKGLVVARHFPCPTPEIEWPAVLGNYLLSQDEFPGSMVPHGWPGWSLQTVTDYRAAGRAPLVLVPFSSDQPQDCFRTVEDCLQVQPEAIVLVLGLGKTGSCPGINGLLSCFSNSSTMQFQLLREQSGSFSGSGLGIIYAQNHSSFDSVLNRLKALFAGNFSFLTAVKDACAAGIKTGVLEEANKKLVIEKDTCKHQLATKEWEISTKEWEISHQKWEISTKEWEISHQKWENETKDGKIAELEFELQAARQELARMQSSKAVRVIARLKRLVRRLAPQQSIRRAILRRMRGLVRRS